MKIPFILIISVLLIINTAECQSPGTYRQELSRIDSLLSLGLLSDAKELIGHTVCTDGNDSVNGSFQWTGHKCAEYTDLLHRIDSSENDISENDSHYVLVIMRSSARFVQTDAGWPAAGSFKLAVNSYERGDMKGMIRNYLIADFLRKGFILRETERLTQNADLLQLYLENSRKKIDVIKQLKDSGGGFVELSTAEHLWDMWESEDRHSLAFRITAGELEPRYQGFERELKRQRSERVSEETSEYRIATYTFGVSAGAIYSTGEKFPPYTGSTVEVDALGGSTVTAEYAVNEDENTIKNTKGYYGYDLGVSGSWYVKDYLSLELDLSYSSIERKRLAVHPFFGDPLVLPEYSSSISYSSIALAVNYLIRIKTGFRLFSGIGTGITFPFAPESRSYRIERYSSTQFLFTSLPAMKTPSFRMLMRTGLEYLPSRSSFLSYSIIAEGSLRLTSPENTSLLFLRMFVRLNVLF